MLASSVKVYTFSLKHREPACFIELLHLHVFMAPVLPSASPGAVPSSQQNKKRNKTGHSSPSCWPLSNQKMVSLGYGFVSLYLVLPPQTAPSAVSGISLLLSLSSLQLLALYSMYRLALPMTLPFAELPFLSGRPLDKFLHFSEIQFAHEQNRKTIVISLSCWL